MEKKNILTYGGLKKYEDELQELKVVRRKEVAQKIKEAREQGDLSENAEYDAAKDEQRDILFLLGLSKQQHLFLLFRSFAMLCAVVLHSHNAWMTCIS